LKSEVDFQGKEKFHTSQMGQIQNTGCSEESRRPERSDVSRRPERSEDSRERDHVPSAVSAPKPSKENKYNICEVVFCGLLLFIYGALLLIIPVGMVVFMFEAKTDAQRGATLYAGVAMWGTVAWALFSMSDDAIKIFGKVFEDPPSRENEVSSKGK
jgi:hypothetical protein